VTRTGERTKSGVKSRPLGSWVGGQLPISQKLKDFTGQNETVNISPELEDGLGVSLYNSDYMNWGGS